MAMTTQLHASPSGPKIRERGKAPRDYRRSWTRDSWVRSSTGFSKPVGFVKVGSWERDDERERRYALRVTDLRALERATREAEERDRAEMCARLDI